MPRVIYDIDTPGTTSLADGRSGYSWESTIRVPDGGSVLFELATAGDVRITRSVSVGELFFHRSYQGVRNKESRFIQFMFVRGGTLVWRSGAGERPIPSETFTVIKDSPSYSARYIPDGGTMELLVVAIPKHELALLIDNLDFEHRVETDRRMVNLLYGLGLVLFQSAEILSNEHKAQLKQILLRHIAEWITRPVNQRTRPDPLVRRYQEIEAYIRNNISDPSLGADIIAREFHISSRYLSMVLMKNGRNLREIVNQHRLEKARGLLSKADAGSQTSIKEIGSMVGYQNAAHFSYLFRKYTGVSPTRYLQRCIALRHKAACDGQELPPVTESPASSGRSPFSSRTLIPGQ